MHWWRGFQGICREGAAVKWVIDVGSKGHGALSWVAIACVLMLTAHACVAHKTCCDMVHSVCRNCTCHMHMYLYIHMHPWQPWPKGEG